MSVICDPPHPQATKLPQGPVDFQHSTSFGMNTVLHIHVVSLFCVSHSKHTHTYTHTHLYYTGIKVLRLACVCS